MDSNNTNYTYMSEAGWDYELTHWINAHKTSQITVAIGGTLLNLWLLLAILTSREMRSRLRNKIICSTFVVHLLDSTLIIPMSLASTIREFNPGCAFYSFFENLQLMQDCIANWLVVMLLVVFIAQIQDCNPAARLTARAVTLGTVGVLVFPWIVSITIIPAIVYDYYKHEPFDNCFHPTIDSYQVIKSIDTAVPIVLAVLLLIVAAVLRYRRFTRRFSLDSMETELISQGPEIDNLSAYVVAVIMFTLCDLLLMVLYSDLTTFLNYGIKIWVKLIFPAVILSEVRAALMPLSWLLLPDVRQRIKTWRPCCRPVPDIDLTVTYRKEDN